MFRTLLRTDSTSHTVLLIDVSDIILYMDGILRAVLFAKTASDTSGSANIHNRFTFVLIAFLHKSYKLFTRLYFIELLKVPFAVLVSYILLSVCSVFYDIYKFFVCKVFTGIFGCTYNPCTDVHTIL